MELNPIFVSIRTALVSTILVSFAGIFIAYRLLNKQGIVKYIIEILILFPLFMPPSLVGYITLILIGKKSFVGKLIDYIFKFSFIFTWQGAVVACFIVALPIMYQCVKGAMGAIDKNCIQAAKLDGATNLIVLSKIILPMCIRGILSGIILSFARAFGEFGASLMICGNIPGKTENIPMAIYFAVENGDFTKANKLTFVVIIISTTLIVVNNFLLKKREF